MLSEGETWGWTSAPVIVLLLVSLVLVGDLGALRAAASTIRWSTCGRPVNRMVLTADIAGLIISLTMYLFLPIVVEFVQVPPQQRIRLRRVGAGRRLRAGSAVGRHARRQPDRAARSSVATGAAS